MSQLQSLILTSYYSALLYPFNANFAPLRAALGRLVSFRQKTKAIAPNTADFHFISEVRFINNPNRTFYLVDQKNPQTSRPRLLLNLFWYLLTINEIAFFQVERMFATRDYLNSAESLRFCIQQATNIDFPEDFDINKASARLVAPSLIYSYFRLRMLEPQRARETIEACLAVMDHASITDESVLSLLFMLRTFIPYCPIPPTDLYHKLVERVTKFYLWPQPYSDCARDLLELLNVEIKSPGTAMRARIHEESPSVYPRRCLDFNLIRYRKWKNYARAKSSWRRSIFSKCNPSPRRFHLLTGSEPSIKKGETFSSTRSWEQNYSVWEWK